MSFKRRTPKLKKVKGNQKPKDWWNYNLNQITMLPVTPYARPEIK